MKPWALLVGLVLLGGVAVADDALAWWAGVPQTPPDTLSRDLPPDRTGPLNGRLIALRDTARRYNEAADWRQFAKAAEEAGHHIEASAAYRRESDIYRKHGDVQAAEAEWFKAKANQATLNVYYARPADAADTAALNTGARLEPPLGCYLGAFIDRDDQIASYVMDNQRHGDIASFAHLVGRRHATYYTYTAYGQPFPWEWVRQLQEQGAIPQIAWEPRNLDEVRDDGYLEGWVQQAAATRCPIFIRFASEMNGAWTRYHDDPAAYRKAFRMVYQAFRRAPNVALIWCPNAIPRSNIDDYYPGDDATDWVGVNFYNVPYLDDLKYNPGDRIHPTDLLDEVYRKYSARKPIAIGEYAASHHSDLDAHARPRFAADRIAELYESLMTEYPRVKLVNWYDCNNLVHAPSGRQMNDFLLTDDTTVLDTYREATSPAWFLDATSWQAPVVFHPLEKGLQLSSPLVLRANVRCWTEHPRLYFLWDGRVVHATSSPAGYGVRLDQATPGAHVFRLVAYDDEQRLVGERSYPVNIMP